MDLRALFTSGLEQLKALPAGTDFTLSAFGETARVRLEDTAQGRLVAIDGPPALEARLRELAQQVPDVRVIDQSQVSEADLRFASLFY